MSTEFIERFNRLLEDSKLMQAYPGLQKAAALSRLTGVSEHGVRYWLREGVQPRAEPLHIIVKACLERIGVRGLEQSTTDWLLGHIDQPPYQGAGVITTNRDKNFQARVIAQINRIAADKKIRGFNSLSEELHELLVVSVEVSSIHNQELIDDVLVQNLIELFVQTQRKLNKTGSRQAS
jgi:hypothetical protein